MYDGLSHLFVTPTQNRCRKSSAQNKSSDDKKPEGESKIVTKKEQTNANQLPSPASVTSSSTAINLSSTLVSTPVLSVSKKMSKQVANDETCKNLSKLSEPESSSILNKTSDKDGKVIENRSKSTPNKSIEKDIIKKRKDKIHKSPNSVLLQHGKTSKNSSS